jgi:hypothetical protein
MEKIEKPWGHEEIWALTDNQWLKIISNNNINIP